MLFSSKVSTTFVVGYQKSEEQRRIQILDQDAKKHTTETMNNK